jgi:membrane-associated protease RseP (regulator of RpoE activity)
MRNISRTRLLAAALGCLAIAAASVSLADVQPAATQPGQPTASALDPAGTLQPPATSTQPPAATTTTPSPAQLNQPASSSQPPLNLQPPADQTNEAAKSKTSSGNEWPSPRRYDPNNPQGGSLGVNVVSDGGGIIITNVRPGTPAQQMGLQRGDRVESVNGQPVEAIDQFISFIRNMNAGDQVEIGIVRDQTENKLSGKLEAYGQALARGTDPNSGYERRMSGSGRFSNRMADNSANPNVQTSYEERNQSGQQSSGDLEARLMNLEQKLNKVEQDVAEIRTAIGNKPKPSAGTSSTTGSQTPAAGALGNPSPRAPSAFRPTPGQPPSTK